MFQTLMDYKVRSLISEDYSPKSGYVVNFFLVSASSETKRQRYHVTKEEEEIVLKAIYHQCTGG